MNQNKIKEIIQEAEKHFRTKIPVPTVFFHGRMQKSLAYTSFRRKAIVISRELENQPGILEVVLLHELSHQITRYVYGSNEHCANWFNVCLYLGMDINQIREIYYI